MAVHTFVIVAFLIAGLRTFGRRTLAQLTVVETVIVLLLGSAVETAMVAGDTSLAAGLVCAGSLLVLNRLLAVVAARFPRVGELVGGRPVLLVHDGHVLEDHLRRAGLTRSDLEQALRERGEEQPAGLRSVVLESNGAIHVVPESS